MMNADKVLLVIAFGVPLIGFLTTLSVAITQGSPAYRFCQRCFMLAVVLISGLAVVVLTAGAACWFTCAVTLALMIVGATLDLGRSREIPAF